VKNQKKSKLTNLSRIVGILSIIISLLFNKFTFGWLFSADGSVEYPKTTVILIFQVFLFLWGICMIISAKKRHNLLAFCYGIAK